MQDESDDALMRRAGSGDKAAFAVLVRRHLARAMAVAQRIVANRSDAEEIVQETFLRCWQKAPEWLPANDRDAGDAAGRAQIGTWLYRVLVNLCLDRRRRPRPVEIEAAAEVADDRANAFDVRAASEARRCGHRSASSPSRPAASRNSTRSSPSSRRFTGTRPTMSWVATGPQ